MQTTPTAKPKQIRCAAISATQNGQRIFTGIMPAEDLISVTTTDNFDSSLPLDHPDQGYQRPAERPRITKLGTHLIKSIVHKEGNTGGMFPTAVVLASRSPLKYQNGELLINDWLQITDGQHRIKGFDYAINSKGEDDLAKYPVPFVIMEPESKVVEMHQFNTINGNAKSVRTDLVNAILTATVATKGDDSIQGGDRWKVVVTKVVTRLDEDPGSPWYGLIAMADEKAGGKGTTKLVRATSFMSSIKPVYNWLRYLGKFNNMSTQQESDLMFSVLAPYWSAIAQVCPAAFAEPANYVIQKTPGLFSLHKLLEGYLLNTMLDARLTWTVQNFARLLQGTIIEDSQYWHKSTNGAAAYGSMKGFAELYDLLLESLKTAAANA